jgi:sulfopyruvate decarboxylase TPP-binding subunit
MLDGPSVVAGLKAAGATHVVWVPDSELGKWEAALTGPNGLPLVRVCREGEAFAVAAGLYIGGQRPVIMIQCTGLFEAGDALRNVIHDMGLPLFMIVGVRSHKLLKQNKTTDNCPVFTEPILQAWRIPYVLLEESHSAADLVRAYEEARAHNRAGAALIAE